jgi:hypothetical protein
MRESAFCAPLDEDDNHLTFDGLAQVEDGWMIAAVKSGSGVLGFHHSPPHLLHPHLLHHLPHHHHHPEQQMMLTKITKSIMTRDLYLSVSIHRLAGGVHCVGVHGSICGFCIEASTSI